VLSPTVGVWYETPVGVDDAEDGRADDGLHHGRAWHRYRYCYRRADPLRVLVAGCGEGRSALRAAGLNPGASVLGFDASAEAVRSARGRAEAAGYEEGGAVGFRVHDPDSPLPGGWGAFDFIVCRGLLAGVGEPARVLGHLARALDPGGLLLVSLPSRDARRAVRSVRQAVEALAPPGAGPDERTALAADLLQALRPDHPVLAAADGVRHADPGLVLARILDDRPAWTLDGAARLLAGAGLKLLYAATPWRWRPDRVFAPDALSDRLRLRVDHLTPENLSRLVDALDPGLLDDEYQLYACPAAYTPPLPDWPSARLDDPRTFDRLVPERTGLADLSAWPTGASAGRTTYRLVTGSVGEFDRMSGLLFSAVDGMASCGEIDRQFLSQTRAGDDVAVRQGRWVDLADNGLIVLKPFQVS